MIQASRFMSFVPARPVFAARRHQWRSGLRLAIGLPIPEAEDEAPASTLVEDVTYFAACYAAGFVFFLIMLS